MRALRGALLSVFCLTLPAQDFTAAKDAVMGREMANAVRQSTTPVESQAVQEYVARLGARLSATGWSFTVVATERSNALHEPIMLPGRYVFVPVSLVLAANDEAEFAGMIAQAMAHKPLRSSPGSIPKIVVIERFAGDDPLPVSMIAGEREMELEADQAAILTMSRAGFDPAALVRYIERVQPADQRFSIFPPRDARIAALRKAIGDLPPAVYAEGSEFRAIRNLIRPPSPPG